MLFPSVKNVFIIKKKKAIMPWWKYWIVHKIYAAWIGLIICLQLGNKVVYVITCIITDSDHLIVS